MTSVQHPSQTSCQRNPTYNFTQIAGVSVVKVVTYFAATMYEQSNPATSVFGEVDAYYTLEVQAEDDLIITGLHVVQAVQTPKDNVTLIGGKKTVARVFIHSLGEECA